MDTSLACSTRYLKAEGITAALSVNKVSKCYSIYDTPKDRLKELIFKKFGKNYGKEFWALQNSSFEIFPGETFGIIGRNGSGKSTLLQIIAGIIKPTTGLVSVNGKIAALLELGSGFNPEFTGIENVYLNGTLFGLTKNEVEKRLDDILNFADIGEFINQPVKTYSSGMFVRLAFAVATSVDSNILLIDEALAVGDVFFRQKCYSKLQKLKENGTSIVLVSHSMNDVEQYCDNAMLLDKGIQVFVGSASEAVRQYYLLEQANNTHRYIASKEDKSETFMRTNEDRLGQREKNNYFWPTKEAFFDIYNIVQISNGWSRCLSVALTNSEGQANRVFEQGETAVFFYEFDVLQDIEVPISGIAISNDKNITVHGKNTLQHDTIVPLKIAKGSRVRFKQEIQLSLAVGEYTFEVGLSTIKAEEYLKRGTYNHDELNNKEFRICHLVNIGSFNVTYRKKGTPVQLLHHGVSDLKGNCEILSLDE